MSRHEHGNSPEEHNEVDHADWHKHLRSFSNAKTPHVGISEELVEERSRCLVRPDDGEHPFESLPEQQELEHYGGRGNEFTSFTYARPERGPPCKLVLSSRGSSPGLLESVTVSPRQGAARPGVILILESGWCTRITFTEHYYLHPLPLPAAIPR